MNYKTILILFILICIPKSEINKTSAKKCKEIFNGSAFKKDEFPRPGVEFILGNGFFSNGQPITVSLVGNEAVYLGALYFHNPLTGKRDSLFTNHDGKNTDQIIKKNLGVFPKGAPIIFIYKNIQSALQFQFERVSGYSKPGDYNGIPLPVSGKQNARCKDGRFAISGRVHTDTVEFRFEDAGDYDYSDIIFSVTGVKLSSEIKLTSPDIKIRKGRVFNKNSFLNEVEIELASPSNFPDAVLYYTLDGSQPDIDTITGAPKGSTKQYSNGILVKTDVVIKAISWKPGIQKEDEWVSFKSTIPTEKSFKKIQINIIQAWYRDQNGDGHIDAAEIQLNNPNLSFEDIADTVEFKDPFSKKTFLIATHRFKKSSQGWQIQFNEMEIFEFGTFFEKNFFGKLIGANPLSFEILDGVGPVIKKATSLEFDSSDKKPELIIELSESVVLDEEELHFPYKIQTRPSGINATEKIIIFKAAKKDGRTFVYTFLGDFFPVAGDSLTFKAPHNIKDERENLANQRQWVPVQGQTPEFKYKVDVIPPGVTQSEMRQKLSPLKNSVFVNKGDASTCLNCSNINRILQFEKSVYHSPSFEIETEGPFEFTAYFYSSLGEFINKGAGFVTQKMLDNISIKEGKYKLSLSWHPVSNKGSQVGTGAYIARIEIRAGQGKTGSSYIDKQGVMRKSKISKYHHLIRFGYMAGG